MRTKISTTNTLQNQMGFSLAELIVTVFILGLILSVAVPLFSNSIENQRIKECDASKKIVGSAIMRAAAVTGKDLANITSADCNRFINGGISSLACDAQTNPIHTYSVVGGVISPAHNHR